MIRVLGGEIPQQHAALGGGLEHRRAAALDEVDSPLGKAQAAIEDQAVAVAVGPQQRSVLPLRAKSWRLKTGHARALPPATASRNTRPLPSPSSLLTARSGVWLLPTSTSPSTAR